MIIKLFSMPRSGSNWIAHNIEMTWPDVRVWHNRGGWKHGVPKLVEGADAYLFCHRSHGDWLDAMHRYISGSPVVSGGLQLVVAEDWYQHEDVLTLQYEGWRDRVEHFYAKKQYLWKYDPSREHMVDTLRGLEEAFGLSEPDRYAVEHRYVLKFGDSNAKRVFPMALDDVRKEYALSNRLTRPRKHDENLPHYSDADFSSGSRYS